VDAPIGRHPTNRLKMAVAAEGEGREATSFVHTLGHDGTLTLTLTLTLNLTLTLTLSLSLTLTQVTTGGAPWWRC